MNRFIKNPVFAIALLLGSLPLVSSAMMQQKNRQADQQQNALAENSAAFAAATITRPTQTPSHLINADIRQLDFATTELATTNSNLDHCADGSCGARSGPVRTFVHRRVEFVREVTSDVGHVLFSGRLRDRIAERRPILRRNGGDGIFHWCR